MNRGKGGKKDDFVAEGVWLTAESMTQLLFNHLQGGKAMTEPLWKCDSFVRDSSITG